MVSNHLSRGFNPLLCRLSYTGLSSHTGLAPMPRQMPGKAPIPACWVAVRCVYHTIHLVTCQQGKRKWSRTHPAPPGMLRRDIPKKVPRPAATDRGDCKKEEMKGITMPKSSVTIFYHTISSGVNNCPAGSIPHKVSRATYSDLRKSPVQHRRCSVHPFPHR